MRSASWSSHLDGLAASNAQASLAYWTRPGASARHDLTALFLARFGAPPPTSFELFGDDVLRRANLLSFGHEQLPTFDLAASRYVMSFGADFLGTWNSPVAQARRLRPHAAGPARHSRGVRAGGTADVADRRERRRVGADSSRHRRRAGARPRARDLPGTSSVRPTPAGRAGAQIDGWSRGLADYTPKAVEERTGVSAARVERLARELADQRPSVAIIGGAPLAQTNGLFQALAVNALNALLGSVDAPGGVSFMPQTDPPARAAAARRCVPVAADILAAEQSPVQLLLVDGVNPVFATPAGWRVREAILKVPFVVSFGSFIDDTSVLADLILPDHSFLESWTEARPESGATIALATVAGPAMKPLYQTRATPDVLLDVAAQAQAADQARIAVEDVRSDAAGRDRRGQLGDGDETGLGRVEKG